MPDQPDGAPTSRAFPLTKTEFALRSGRSKSSISEAIRGPLAGALLPNERIDANAPAAHAWYAKRGIDAHAMLGALRPTAASTAAEQRPAPGRDSGRPEPLKPRAAVASEPDLDDVPADKLPDMTLRQITERFGTMQGFQDFLDARKTAADIRTKELKNRVLEGRYIEREFVRVHVFGLLQATNDRLLTDMPRSAASIVFSLSRSGGSQHDVELALRERVSVDLESAKTRVIRVLNQRNANAEQEFEEEAELRGSKEDDDAAPVRGPSGRANRARGSGSDRRSRRDARRPDR